MVCKEDVLLWFKDLESYKRIDVMYELLHMCIPFEVRFLGSCIEEIGKHSYQELRGSAITANDLDKLTKDASLTQGLADDSVRHRVLIYLTLLSGRNCKCANWFYDTLLRTEWVESSVLKGNYKDDNLQNELLTLFTLGLHHPAFSFVQKTFFGNMLAHVQRECKKQISSKPFSTCPPGFGYSSIQKVTTHADTPVIPVKTAPLCHGDSGSHQHPQHLAHPVAGPVEFIHMWNRPGFAGPISGAPEMAPFPPPPVSPLVSQPTSPTPSRTGSPHRVFPLRPAPGLQPLIQFVEVPTAVSPIVPLDLFSPTSLPPFSSDIKPNDDDLNHVPDDKSRDNPWLNSVMLHVGMKPPNGIRFTSYNKVPHQYFIDQMQALNLDGENSLHCSSSSSSSNNSLNQSPPDTPSTTPAVPHHGPGRGENKSRMNGVPQFVNPCPPSISTGPPLCDSTPPPPPAPTLSNCSVPYSNYPPQVTLTAIPNRSVFNYTQAYRPPFSAPYNYQPPEIYSYSCPYMPVIFSSAPSQVPPRNPNCFNCGAIGHTGSECSGQTIEEITQKKAYTLEYNSPLSDADK